MLSQLFIFFFGLASLTQYDFQLSLLPHNLHNGECFAFSILHFFCLQSFFSVLVVGLHKQCFCLNFQIIFLQLYSSLIFTCSLAFLLSKTSFFPHLFFNSFCFSCFVLFFCFKPSQFKVYVRCTPIISLFSQFPVYHARLFSSLLIYVQHRYQFSPIFTSWQIWPCNVVFRMQCTIFYQQLISLAKCNKFTIEIFTCSSTFSSELWWSLNVFGEYIFEVSRIICLRELVIVNRTKNHLFQECFCKFIFFCKKLGDFPQKFMSSKYLPHL